MLQSLRQTIRAIAGNDGLPGGEAFTPRLRDTVLHYGAEVARDLNQKEWQSRYSGSMHAGYLAGLLGRPDLALSYLEQSLRLLHENRDKYSESEPAALKRVVRTLKEIGVDREVIATYRRRLLETSRAAKPSTAEIEQSIRHIEADLECEVGDLAQAYSGGRTKQGKLYQKLGRHDLAIAHFEEAMRHDRRDFQRETSIKNMLLIVDSQLAQGSVPAARDIFLALMEKLGSIDIKPGEPLPTLLIQGLDKFLPYLPRLELGDALATMADLARARLAVIDEQAGHWERMEICHLTELLGAYHVGRQEYREASEVYDAGRARLEYKDHLSRVEQAEFALRGGQPEKAAALMAEDDAEGGRRSSLDGRTPVLDRANVELQLGQISAALDRLDHECARTRRSLVSGSFASILELRRVQVSILRRVIGAEAVNRLRDSLPLKESPPQLPWFEELPQ